MVYSYYIKKLRKSQEKGKGCLCRLLSAIKSVPQDTFVGAERGIRAFSGAPRSAIINCRLCRQVFGCQNSVRQSVLLPQNGSHPQLPSQCRESKKRQETKDVLSFLVEATGICPKGRASSRRQLSYSFQPPFAVAPWLHQIAS